MAIGAQQRKTRERPVRGPGGGGGADPVNYSIYSGGPGWQQRVQHCTCALGEVWQAASRITNIVNNATLVLRLFAPPSAQA